MGISFLESRTTRGMFLIATTAKAMIVDLKSEDLRYIAISPQFTNMKKMTKEAGSISRVGSSAAPTVAQEGKLTNLIQE